LKNSEVIFDLDQIRSRLEQVDTDLASPENWENPKKLQLLQQEKKRLENKIHLFDSLQESRDELDVLLELSDEGENVKNELEPVLEKFDKKLEDAELKTLFTEKEDPKNAILTIHPGAGGTESQDWSEILLRMYLRYAERKDFETKILDISPGDEAGIKSVTLQIQGDYAYGILGQETGVHRLVRISPFDANKRRHTSFAAVFVYPEIDEDIQLDISADDLRIDTSGFRTRGPACKCNRLGGAHNTHSHRHCCPMPK
jgi:peptide chain release factor 2